MSRKQGSAVSVSDSERRAALGQRPSQQSVHPRATLCAGVLFAQRYRIDAHIGEGSTGHVYVADDEQSGRRVALKIVHGDLADHRQVVGRFQREARILSRLQGPNIVQVCDYGQDASGLLYLALEHLDGRSLGGVLRDGDALSLAVIHKIAQGLANAMIQAHSEGIVHRDLSPENVIVEIENNQLLRVAVLDFGMSKALHADVGGTHLTEENMILGTPDYMSPEQVRGGHVDPRADIYAAGTILYHVLMGRPPFVRSSPIAVMTAHLTEEPEWTTSHASDRPLPAALVAVCRYALTKRRSERYQTATDFLRALRSAEEFPGNVDAVVPTKSGDGATATPVSSIPPAPVQSPDPVPNSRSPERARFGIPWWVVAAVLAGLLGMLIGVWIALNL